MQASETTAANKAESSNVVMPTYLRMKKSISASIHFRLRLYLEAACLNQLRSLLVSPKYDNEKGMTLRMKVLSQYEPQ